MKTDRSSLFLMANLGSEMSQIFSHVEKRELQFAKDAVLRADKIIKELLIHPDLMGRRGEIEILRNIIKDVSSAESRFVLKKTEIDEYFMPFALRLMSAK